MGAPRCSDVPSIFGHAEQWFLRAKASLLGSIPCHEGCHQCCIGPFPITLLDAVELRKGIRTLPAGDRHTIELRARDQIMRMEAAFPRLAGDPFLDSWPDSEVDALVTRFADLPCPALQPNGTCGVYPFRPVTCRTMGMPVAAGSVVQGACAVQTFVPVVQLSQALRMEEDRLAEEEARWLQIERQRVSAPGDEILLPYGFLDSTPAPRQTSWTPSENL